MNFAPVAIFAHKRANHLRRLVESLKACEGFDETKVFIFVDGPRHANEAAQVEEVREFVRTCDLPNLDARFSEFNKGLKESVTAGVTELCETYGRAIVLEDDLVVSPVLLTYFNAALRKYADEPRVFSVSGYIYDCAKLQNVSRAFFLPLCNSWGWATWQRAWKGFEPDTLPGPKILDSPSFRQILDVDGFYPFSGLLKLSRDRMVSSWFIRWYCYITLQGGVTLYPPRRYVENHGFGEGATHVGRFNPFSRLVPSVKASLQEVELPEKIEVDFVVLDQLRSCREAVVDRWIASVGILRRRLRLVR